MWNHDGAIEHRERVSVTGIGIGVEQAAEAEKSANRCTSYFIYSVWIEVPKNHGADRPCRGVCNR